MSIPSSHKMRKYSQDLRKNMTKEECHLWYDFLKHLPMMVHRQKVFGKYIADFYIAEANLIIEIDGIQHGTEGNQEYDRERDEYFQKNKIRVLRYSNKSINKDFNWICKDIEDNIFEETK